LCFLFLFFFMFLLFFFFFMVPAPTETYPLPLHCALPISLLLSPSSRPPLPCPLFTLPLLALTLSSAPLSLLLGEGVIRVSDSSLLDREVMPVFNLLLTATDQGATPMASTIDIQVVLGDVNDNSPVFGELVYNADIVEVCRHTVVSSVPIANM